jgi:hypothetical protein
LNGSFENSRKISFLAPFSNHASASTKPQLLFGPTAKNRSPPQSPRALAPSWNVWDLWFPSQQAVDPVPPHAPSDSSLPLTFPT